MSSLVLSSFNRSSIFRSQYHRTKAKQPDMRQRLESEKTNQILQRKSYPAPHFQLFAPLRAPQYSHLTTTLQYKLRLQQHVLGLLALQHRS